MKLRLFLCGALAFTVLPLAYAQPVPDYGNAVVTQGKTVPWNRVPEPAQMTLKSQAGTASVADVKELVVDGQVVYVGTFRHNGTRLQVPVTADGSLYTGAKQIAWNEIPTAVQNGLLAQQGAPVVQSVTQQVTAGRTIYLVSVLNNGFMSQLQFGEDGTYLGTVGETATPLSAEPVAWNQLPSSVQRTATTQMGTARMTGATKSVMNGQTVYNINAVEPDGAKMEFRVGEEGVVIARGIVTEAAGAPRPGREPGGLTFEQIPITAQSAVRTESGSEPILGVQPQLINGQLCYEVSFRKEGKLMTMCVSEDGAIVK